jgi:hypothetical protein
MQDGNELGLPSLQAATRLLILCNDSPCAPRFSSIHAIVSPRQRGRQRHFMDRPLHQNHSPSRYHSLHPQNQIHQPAAADVRACMAAVGQDCGVSAACFFEGVGQEWHAS